MGLSVKQDRARTGGDYVRVIAGPGSGKTTLLVARTKFLLERPGSVVGLVTFANPAAQEMRERMSGRVDMNRVKVSTFDAFARQQFYPFLNGRRPPKYFERQILIRRAIAECASGFDEETAGEVIEELNCRLHPEEGSPECVELFQVYQELMEADGLIDFAEVARQAVLKMMSGEIEPIPVTHLLVDEFQDTAPVQLAWLAEHWKRGIKVTVVGDDDQSIYGFRHAMGNEGMNEFASKTSAEDFFLDECYRCAPEIVEISGKVIGNNLARIPKKIKSMASPGGVVTHGRFDEMEDQFKALDSWIKEIRAEGPGQTIGILARTNRGLDDIEAMLRVGEYKYRRIGGKSIWETQGAGLLLGLAELATFRTELEVPNAANALSWAQVPQNLVEQYRRHISDHGLFSGLPGSLQDDGRVKGFHEQLAMWAGMIVGGQEAPALSCIAAWVTDHARTAVDSKTAWVAAKALKGNPSSKATLAQRIRSVAMGNGKADESDPDVIDIATMHGAKGMEWHGVWLTGADEPGIPGKQALETEANGSIHEIEEERRLFYVAMTRAKRWLAMASNKRPSRFVVEAGLWSESEEQNAKAKQQAAVEEG
jgi:superfamily I DNA/RNA helicase